MPRGGKYGKYTQDERKWQYLGDKGCFHDVYRIWRSEYTSAEEFNPTWRFKREPHTDPPPDRGGWSCRHSTTSFRDTLHEKDSRINMTTKITDEGCKVAWRKGIQDNPDLLASAPVDIADDRQARVSAALGALYRIEQVLHSAMKQLDHNRDVVLHLMFRDYQVLKDSALQLYRDRRHLLKDVHEDFHILKTKAKDLEAQRKVLLNELQHEVHDLEINAYNLQVGREDAISKIRAARLKLEARKDKLALDPKLQPVRDIWNQLDELRRALLSDQEMLPRRVRRYWQGLNYVCDHVRQDRLILLEAVQPFVQKRSVEDVVGHTSKLYWECEAMLEAVSEDTISLENMMKAIRVSHGIVHKVLVSDFKDYQDATQKMREDRALVTAIIDNTMVSGKW